MLLASLALRENRNIKCAIAQPSPSHDHNINGKQRWIITIPATTHLALLICRLVSEIICNFEWISKQ